ncbi:MAG: hypothetical protein U5K75_02480 [Ahrensia sp.]|nr:hypothetical protein [Ahrensia sp.]
MMHAPDQNFSPLDHMVDRAFENVLDNLKDKMRAAAQKHVDQELNARTAELALYEARVARMEQSKLAPRPVPIDILQAAQRVAQAAVQLEDAQFSVGERHAREKLEKATKALCKAINNHPHLKIKERS